MSIWNRWSKLVDMGFGSNAPAIWLYPRKPQEVIVDVKFKGKGFMTLSTPSYNQGWRIHADATGPLPRVTGIYVDDGAFTFLDYDGFRDGNFQRTVGWCIKKEDLLSWQRTKLQELGYAQNEIDDVNYTYGRLLLERKYPQKYFAIYPQHDKIVNASVSLHIEPKPDVVHRMWMYFVPTDHGPKLKEPVLKPFSRTGFTVVELGFLTDAEIPKKGQTKEALVSSATMFTSPATHDSDLLRTVLQPFVQTLKSRSLRLGVLWHVQPGINRAPPFANVCF